MDFIRQQLKTLPCIFCLPQQKTSTSSSSTTTVKGDDTSTEQYSSTSAPSQNSTQITCSMLSTIFYQSVIVYCYPATDDFYIKNRLILICKRNIRQSKLYTKIILYSFLKECIIIKESSLEDINMGLSKKRLVEV